MLGIDDLIIYTAMIGSTLIGGDLLNIAVKNLNSKSDNLASGKFGEKSDLHELLGNDGLIISKNIQLCQKSSFEHVLVIGPTGSHKSTSLFFPNLLTNSLGNCSLVIMDSKGELFKYTAKYQEKIGRIPILFNPLSPNNTLTYNPLEQTSDLTEVRELSQNLIQSGALSIEISSGKKSGGVEWLNMCIPLFTSALLYAKEKGNPLLTISNALKLIINNSTKDLDLILNNSSDVIKTQYNLFKNCLESPKTAASIKITLSSSLQLFTDLNIIKSTKATDFTAEDLRNKPIALYIAYPERKSAYLSPFLSCFFSQLISKLMDAYSSKSLPVYFLFDEFANAGYIMNFQNIVATARSRKMGFLLCVQSTSQLNQIYGIYNTKSILNNLKTKIVLPGLSDMETLNYISELSGETEITLQSTSKYNNSTSKNYSQSKKKLLSSDEIRRLKDKELLIIAHNKYAVKDTQNLYFEQKKYLDNVDELNLPISI